MSQSVTAFNVFVASPGDVIEERQKALEVMVRWNFTHSAEQHICFFPVLWEISSVPDLQMPVQAAINEQLLRDADYLVGIFYSRLGTPTQDYPSGTVEEIKSAPGKSAVFFRDSENFSLKPSDPAYKQKEDQYQKVIQLRDELSGYHSEHRTVDEFGAKLAQRLDEWAKDIELPRPALELRKEPSDYQGWLFEWSSKLDSEKEQKGTVLLYNIELSTFQTPGKFRRTWTGRDIPQNIHSIVLLLPPYKIKRLQNYLRGYSREDQDLEIMKRFEVCQFRPSDSANHTLKSTAAAFALFRTGIDPRSGRILPPAHLIPLTEPFSTKDLRESEGADFFWSYNYSFCFSTLIDCVQELADVWDQAFDSTMLKPIAKILPPLTIPHPPTSIPPRYKKPVAEKVLDTIHFLRERVFDPIEPSYLLTENYFFLDWNAAFEMVFPTSYFYRGEYVLEFARCLNNVKDVITTGEQSYVSRTPVETPPFHVETIRYTSPKYGEMRFTKLAAKVVKDPISDRTTGYIVSLNVDKVERLEKYEADLVKTNEYEDMIARLATPFERILSKFPDYLALKAKHIRSLSNSNRILEVAAGPGILTDGLLGEGKHVTAVEQSDAMARLIRQRCKRFLKETVGFSGAVSKETRIELPALSIVKATIDTLHAPPADLAGEIGFFPPYDGAAIISLFEKTCSPKQVLTSLREEFLSADAAVSITLPKSGAEVNYILNAIDSYEGVLNEKDRWSDDEYNTFASVLRGLEKSGYIVRYTIEEMEQLLRETGFEALAPPESVLCDQAIFAVARVENGVSRCVPQ